MNEILISLKLHCVPHNRISPEEIAAVDATIDALAVVPSGGNDPNKKVWFGTVDSFYKQYIVYSQNAGMLSYIN